MVLHRTTRSYHPPPTTSAGASKCFGASAGALAEYLHFLSTHPAGARPLSRSVGMCAERVSDAEQRRANDLELAQRASRGQAEARRAVAQRLFDRVRTTVKYLAGSHP